jgi:hypothetical protein
MLHGASVAQVQVRYPSARMPAICVRLRVWSYRKRTASRGLLSRLRECSLRANVVKYVQTPRSLGTTRSLPYLARAVASRSVPASGRMWSTKTMLQLVSAAAAPTAQAVKTLPIPGPRNLVPPPFFQLVCTSHSENIYKTCQVTLISRVSVFPTCFRRTYGF